MSKNRTHILLAVLFATASALPITRSLQAADPQSGAGNRAPAGQVCPQGSFVIGFDAESNILCSAMCGNGILDAGEACDDGNAVAGDGCSASCRTEAAAAQGNMAVVAAEAAPAAAPASPAPGAVSGASLAIDSVKPWSVAYGTRELTITVRGSGFTSTSVIVFQGTRYPASVNQEGTQLVATVRTRELGMGSYALTVSNGAGVEHTLRKALEVY